MPRTLSESEFNTIQDRVMKSLPDNLDEAGFNRIYPSMLEQELGKAENTPASDNVLGRFAAGAWQNLNPLGIVSAVTSPLETIKNIAGAQLGEAKTAVQRAGEGRLLEAAGHGAAALLPVVGPAAARAGEAIGSGDVAGGLGQATGLLAPFAAPAAISAAKNLSYGGDVSGAGRAGLLERQAVQQVAERTLAPGAPAYKGPAYSVAKELLKRGIKGDRFQLAEAGENIMADATGRIDQAIVDLGGENAPIKAKPIIDALEAKIKEYQPTGRTEPGYEAHVNELQKRIDSIREAAARPSWVPPGSQVPAWAQKATVSPSATLPFQKLREIRDLQYSTAAKGGAYMKRTGQLDLDAAASAAADTGSAIRDSFAGTSPDLASANADFHFGKALTDILDPTKGRPKATAAPSGVTGGAKVSAAVMAKAAGLSPTATAVFAAVIPMLKDVMASPQWQLAKASQKYKLAQALREGSVYDVQKVLKEIKTPTTVAKVGAKALLSQPSEAEGQ